LSLDSSSDEVLSAFGGGGGAFLGGPAAKEKRRGLASTSFGKINRSITRKPTALFYLACCKLTIPNF
jgi:hypothetical protein